MVAAEKGWWAEDLKPFGVENIEEWQMDQRSQDRDTSLYEKAALA